MVLSNMGHKKIWTVSELNQMIKRFFDEQFYPLWIQGEIGNLSIHRSEHVYFTLKDRRSQVKAVFFRGAQMATRLQLQEGSQVELLARISLYEVKGDYQLIVHDIRPRGVGTLQVQVEALKRRLDAEGLFAHERKKSIPLLPRCIGIVSSPDGAALRDFLHIIRRRFPTMHIRIYPAAVQGENAVIELTEGIHFFNQSRSCDVIVITRGGGSAEDLHAFNDERLVRAIATSNIPVISAVGHEIDSSICDFVADLRVATPSAAAELVVCQKDDLLDRLDNHCKSMISALKIQLNNSKYRLKQAINHYRFKDPLRMVRNYQQQLDELFLRYKHSTRKEVEMAQKTLHILSSQLQLLDPKHILKRGYAIVRQRDTKKTIRTYKEVHIHDHLDVLLGNGRITVNVEERMADE